jgi:hypothetical protein
LTDFENILGYIYTSSGPHFSFEMDNLFSTSKEAITTYVYLKHSKENLFTGIAAPRWIWLKIVWLDRELFWL